MGLVNAVVPLERLEEETLIWARQMLRNSPTALRMIKAALNAAVRTFWHPARCLPQHCAVGACGRGFVVRQDSQHAAGRLCACWQPRTMDFPGPGATALCAESVLFPGTTLDEFKEYVGACQHRFVCLQEDGQAGIQELGGNATLLFYQTAEGEEGRRAFLEKRPPDFSKFPRFP